VRVLVVTNMYPSPARPASGRFVSDQVRALSATAGVDVEVFTFDPSGPASYARAAIGLRRAFGGRRFDVVHAHYGLSGWVSLALRGVPHVVTFHGTDLEHPLVGPSSRALARLVALPAPVSATLARSTGVRAGAILPCGVDLERARPIERRPARARLGLEPDGRYLLFPSDPARREKRHDRAQALAAAAGATLLTYEGTQPDEVPYLINAANAVVVPSEREGFGLAPLEALACNVPVAATPVGVAPVALAGVAGTLCAPFDPGRWRHALEPHLEHPDPRIPGRGRARLFERDRLARRVSLAYRDLLDRAALRRGIAPL
jgi:teichuronic acid biosynthesis glycosyltransferase TuaC